jgi:hypothetical protein
MNKDIDNLVYCMIEIIQDFVGGKTLEKTHRHKGHWLYSKDTLAQQ